ncbi:hypothetical protein M2459_003281 [Parabacteroides sp. PF5-5]|uniref:DUF6786 family protein n=1 Tax=unclassified Parabacteroides TaxID=2649774 RepID=UPI002472EF74|nr:MULTISPECIES: DUF6786 family protein [unclassified Parabacteroides]MDH6306556.1 hypothetical protein [Parabacteroides sp. PH5-39]MDH6317523.1 hypothetical protein [Parabacteroides sp. PF5-13]MDH6321267.1 hypothetical protein [Parabacteroides sp. PH5-13]MDH6324999.1 hypothetical protein [Parabacteroides sp. PH5-8]MDH6328708.1 hypothetical protein [Parabacteroides sp. PH5-41]
MDKYDKGTFGFDLRYLSEKDNRIAVLTSDDEQARIIVSPKYQAKVFTSTATGLEGKSLGYLNYDVLDSDEISEHMNGYGGENRFWLGPEGGKFSVYFKPETEQVYDNWHTPKPIDIEPWSVVSIAPKSVSMEKTMEVANYQGTQLQLKINRTVRLLEIPAICAKLGISANEKVQAVAYATENSITNLNDFEWTKDTGTICIWMLDMFNPGPKAVTFIPFAEGDEKDLGIIATTDYFGEIPASHYKVKEGMVFLKTDGKYRSKLGMNAKRTKAIAGNYDPDAKRLTICTFDVDPNAVYLNQEWNPSKDPLVGDALNAYNDGPLEDGSIMGPFLELESCSPAAFIAPQESLKHNHNVFHFVGEEADLTNIVEKLFNISLNELKKVF